MKGDLSIIGPRLVIKRKFEKRIDPSKYDSFHARHLGRISEKLLDVWINTKGYNYKEVKFMSIQKVNWWKKRCLF